jgi:hypothetical protein
MFVKTLLGYATRLVISSLALVGYATKPGQLWQGTSVTPIDARAGLGLEGYDVVSYFTIGRPKKGRPRNAVNWRGVKWLFASPDHRDRFAADPDRYAPQYGGYCAYAVSYGTTAHGDPNQWAVVENRLFVNNNALARRLWMSHRSRNIRTGDVNWPLIPKLGTPALRGSPKVSDGNTDAGGTQP